MNNKDTDHYRKPHVFDPVHNGADECECGLTENADIHESDQAYEERMRPRVVNAPARIWLQAGCDDEVGEIDWKELSHSDVSWCDEKIHNTDIEYARVDPPAVPTDVFNEDRCMFCGGKTAHEPDCDHGVRPISPAPDEVDKALAREVVCDWRDEWCIPTPEGDQVDCQSDLIARFTAALAQARKEGAQGAWEKAGESVRQLSIRSEKYPHRYVSAATFKTRVECALEREAKGGDPK